MPSSAERRWRYTATVQDPEDIGRGPTAPGFRMDAADRLLLERLRRRDQRAFLELVGRHQGAMVHFARSFVRDPAVADEVVQEAWLAFVGGLPRFQERSSLKTWLFSILANKAKTRAVREGRALAFDLDGPEAAAVVEAGREDSAGRWHGASAPGPDRALAGRQALAALAQALETLPPAQRAVVVLRDVEGLDADEVCNILGLSETNQRVLLHRGRHRLRQALQEHR